MDFLNDKTAAILGYAFQNDLLPEFVKEASMPQMEDVEDLRLEAFAKPETREYPCHTKEATILSALYAAATDQENDIKENIIKFASSYDIQENVNDIFNHFNTLLEKQASEMEEQDTCIEKFAMTLTDGEVENNYYNISTKEDTLVSINHLNEDYTVGAVKPHLMRKLACAIVKAANSFDISSNYIPSIIKDYATDKLPDVAMAYNLISLRKSAGVELDAYENIIEKLASDISQSDMEYETLVKLADSAAEELYILDQVNNIEYSQEQPNPYEVLYNGPTMNQIEKFAAEHVRISDIPVPVVDFINISDNVINSNFSKQASELILQVKQNLQGELTVEKSAKAQESLNTLSEDVRKVLLNTLVNTGW